MSETTRTSSADNLLALTARIVVAHAGNNAVEAAELPALIQSVHGALASAGAPPAGPEQLRPAVPVSKSVQRDHLVCLEDGVQVKMLRRYLARRFGLTPEQYRRRWGLPHSYPMVAPGYTERRSQLAKETGLGRKAVAEPPKPAPAPAPVDKAGRPKGGGKARAARAAK